MEQKQKFVRKTNIQAKSRSVKLSLRTVAGCSSFPAPWRLQPESLAPSEFSSSSSVEALTRRHREEAGESEWMQHRPRCSHPVRLMEMTQSSASSQTWTSVFLKRGHESPSEPGSSSCRNMQLIALCICRCWTETELHNMRWLQQL